MDVLRILHPDCTTFKRKDTLMRTLRRSTAPIAVAGTLAAGALLGTVALASPAMAEPMKHWSVPATSR
ncbi:hypothetical protein [Nonomuraea dietziae]|uniref:hypothetical protein n=1 Tax=Nonomuraea dietziae TaxID=65515 RepID=UPI003414850D